MAERAVVLNVVGPSRSLRVEFATTGVDEETGMRWMKFAQALSKALRTQEDGSRRAECARGEAQIATDTFSDLVFEWLGGPLETAPTYSVRLAVVVNPAADELIGKELFHEMGTWD
jgi:hypothetical protein